MTHPQEELIYGFDPLCGWCFAFGPTLRALIAANPDLSVRLRYGGLIVGKRVMPIAMSRNYLIEGLAQIQRMAGIKAGERFYNELLAVGTYVSDSEPPCRAIYVMEQLAPKRAYTFATALPDLFYIDGLPLDNETVLANLAEDHGVSRNLFLHHWYSEVARNETQAAFARTHAEGFRSYPTLLYRFGRRASFIAQGYQSPAEAISRLERLRTAIDHQTLEVGH